MEASERYLAQRLEQLVQGLAARKHLPHAVLAVERGDGSFRWTGAAGQATPEGASMTPGTPFFIASVDKMFTAAAVLKLVERGQVRLDEPVAAFLGEQRLSGLHRLGGIDRTPAITVRHLLSHTSGLPDWLEDYPRGGRSLVERLIEEGDLEYGLDDVIGLVRDRLTPHFPPQPAGAERPKIRYSDTNYRLLSAILEAVTGRPLDRIFDEMLFRPHGLRQTWLAGHSHPPEAGPEPAALWAGPRPLHIPRMMRSIHAVYSTAGDLLQFLRALTRDEVFDDPATFDLMRSRWNRFGFPWDRAALRSPSWPIEYGLGLMRFRLPRFLTPFRPVPAVVGHSGSTGTWLFHCPELDVLLAGSVDQTTAGPVPYRLMPQVLRLLERG